MSAAKVAGHTGGVGLVADHLSSRASEKQEIKSKFHIRHPPSAIEDGFSFSFDVRSGTL